MARRDTDRGPALRAVPAAIATLACLVAAAPAAAAPRGDASAATISGSFADACRGFTAHSSKDISHVEVNYADGRVVKDETVDSADYALDAGAAIDFAVVKSGTTSERFACARENRPPTAILEVRTPECSTWPDGLVDCDGRTARTTWSHSTTDLGHGLIRFFCGWPDDQSCVDAVMPCGQRDFYSLCHLTYAFRATSSSDPDGDIEDWTLDFGDGTSVSGDWTANPPSEISHAFLTHYCPTCPQGELVTLTVTDATGQSASDTQFVHHVFPD